MFKIVILYKVGKAGTAEEKIEKHTIRDFDTFIEACHHAEIYGEDRIVEVLITKQ